MPSIMLSLQPIRPLIETPLPSRTNDRTDKEDAATTKSKTEMEDPSRLPDLKETLDARFKRSITDIFAPHRKYCPFELIETLLPTRVNCRMLRVEPHATKFRTDRAEPKRTVERTESEEAAATAATTDNCRADPTRKAPKRLNEDPRRTAERKDTDEPTQT
jgi:hypothetical protein